MKRIVIPIVIGSAIALATGSTSLSEGAQNTLTPIDSVPTVDQLNYALQGSITQSALPSLIDIALDGVDPQRTGIRLRAIHALHNYCTAPCADADLAHQTVVTLVTTTSGETTGAPVLILRASVETLGQMRVQTDVNLLVPLLDHASRDIRASTAKALRDLCNAQAITPLRVRYSKETFDQVKLAISEALRILDQCSAI